MEEIFTFLTIWLWADLLLNVLSSSYRKITIKNLKEIDDNFKKIKKLFRKN